jgi:CheY-like chemotaxis protein
MARILLIDDDDAVRDMVRLMLERLGHTIVEARDGEEGLSLFCPAAPDLVITDMVMPGMGGLEVVKRLREQRPDLKIIATSGGGPPGSGTCLHAARAAGASAVLVKPFMFDGLEVVIRDLLPAAPAGGDAVAG